MYCTALYIQLDIQVPHIYIKLQCEPIFLTSPSFPLEVHMAPFAIVDLLVAGLEFDAPRAHVHQQVQKPVQQLHGKIIGLHLASRPLLLRALRFPVAEQQESAGLGGAEIEGYGAGLLGVPARQGDVGLGRLEGHGVEGRHVLAAEHQVAMQTDLWVSLDGQTGQLKLEVIVLIDNLQVDREVH